MNWNKRLSVLYLIFKLQWKEVKKVDKKTISTGLIVLSLIAAVLAALDYVVKDLAPLNLGADSWVLVAIGLAAYAIYVKLT